MGEYEALRYRYRPKDVKLLLIAESPPPAAHIESSRHFYRTDKIRNGDRLFVNTIKAIFPDAAKLTETEIEADKEKWLQKFKEKGCYIIEALEESQEHEVTKGDRQAKITRALPRLIKRVQEVAQKNTKIVLIKSNVFEVAAGPLRQAGFAVLNQELVDYPGQFNQRAYREKLQTLLKSETV